MKSPGRNEAPAKPSSYWYSYRHLLASWNQSLMLILLLRCDCWAPWGEAQGRGKGRERNEVVTVADQELRAAIDLICHSCRRSGREEDGKMARAEGQLGRERLKAAREPARIALCFLRFTASFYLLLSLLYRFSTLPWVLLSCSCAVCSPTGPSAAVSPVISFRAKGHLAKELMKMGGRLRGMFRTVLHDLQR